MKKSAFTFVFENVQTRVHSVSSVQDDEEDDDEDDDRSDGGGIRCYVDANKI